jgi:hypothetical protein
MAACNSITSSRGVSVRFSCTNAAFETACQCITPQKDSEHLESLLRQSVSHATDHPRPESLFWRRHGEHAQEWHCSTCEEFALIALRQTSEQMLLELLQKGSQAQKLST